MYLLSRLSVKMIMLSRKNVIVNSVNMFCIFVLMMKWCMSSSMNSVVELSDRIMLMNDSYCSGMIEKFVMRLKFSWIRLYSEYFDLFVKCFLCVILILVGFCVNVYVSVGMNVLILLYMLIVLMMWWLYVCSM